MPLLTPPEHLRFLLGRIDLHVEVPLVEYRELSSMHQGESSETIRERVIAARNIQTARFKCKSATANSTMGRLKVKAHCELDSIASARTHDQILKVARTLADLAGSK